MILTIAGAAILIAVSGDGIFNGADLLAWLLIAAGLIRTSTRQKGITISAAKINGADHFFTNQQDDLGATVAAYLKQEMGKSGR